MGQSTAATGESTCGLAAWGAWPGALSSATLSWCSLSLMDVSCPQQDCPSPVILSLRSRAGLLPAGRTIPKRSRSISVVALGRPLVFLLWEARGWEGLGCTQHQSGALPLPGARGAAFLQEHRTDLPGTREMSSRSCPAGEAHGRAPEQGTRHCDPVHSSPA